MEEDQLSQGFESLGPIIFTLTFITIQEFINEASTCKWNLPTCKCLTGFSYEEMCPDCRDDREHGDVYSRCVCPPKD